MGSSNKLNKAFDILAKFSIIIMLLFLCYKNLTLQNEINNLYGYLYQAEKGYETSLPEEKSIEPAPQKIPIMYKVYITGAVNSPGLYDIEHGKRIADLIELASGASDGADLEIINLAAYVEDARHVRIPFQDSPVEEAAAVFADAPTTQATASQSSKPAYSGPVNINTADLNALMSLPGIGQSIANSIIEYRQQNGGFNSVDEIKNVYRIGEALYNNIKDLIVI